MQFFDALALDAGSVRLTRDGYLVAEARIARTGIQEYRAGELGLTDRKPDEVIRVYRSPEEVFAPEAMASLAHRPMTMDHPAEPVTAANWKRLAIGQTGGDVTRDGDTIRVPLTLMDADAIADVRAGKRQLSVGYSCELVFGDGVTPEGEKYDAVQKGIAGNHVAVCSVARGGPALRIGDTRREAAKPSDGGSKVNTKTILVDGLQVETTDAGAAAIEKLQGTIATLTTAKDAAATQVGTLTALVSTKDGEIAALTAQLADAALTPAKLDAAVAARAAVVADAKTIAGDALAVDGKTDIEIKRAAVAARLGDAAAALDDNAIGGAFAALAATPAAGTPVVDAARAAIANGTANISDAAKERAAAEERERNAWKPKAA